MQIRAWGETDVGLKRENNQDSILVDENLGLFVVADGMGGHRGGEVASAMAVETLFEEIARHKANLSAESPRDALDKAFRRACHRIYKKSTEDSPELMGMGTTLVVAYLPQGDRLYIANVGDSRAYLLHSDKMWQITEDHSLVNEQIRAGVIKEEDLPFVTGKNVITRSVGFEQDVQVDIFDRKLRPGERVLLCSDGLSGLVDDQKIMSIGKSNASGLFVKKCIDAAKKAGGDDNISVILIEAVEGKD